MKELNLEKDEIIVIGGGGHAKVIISILKKTGNYKIAGFTDNESKESILGIPYLGNDDVLRDYFKKKITKAVLGIGQIKSSEHRRSIIDKLLNIGFDFPFIISPDCIVNEEVHIARGTVVMDGVVINSGSSIGEFSIINTKSSIDHDCIIGSFTHIAPGVTLSGNVNIGDRVLIGTGTSIIQDIKIVSGSIVSAGSSVQKSLEKSGVYRGVPARFIKEM